MFVERVRSLLKEKNIFAKDMLKDLGINKDQLKRWEDPNAIIKPIYVSAIANYLGTTPEYLLGQTDDKGSPPGEPQGLDEKTTKAVMKLSRLSDEQKAKALLYIEYLEFQEHQRTQ